jgi:UDP-glucuronate decarboxylase
LLLVLQKWFAFAGEGAAHRASRRRAGRGLVAGTHSLARSLARRGSGGRVGRVARMMNASLNHRRVEVLPGNEKYTPKPQKQWSLGKTVEYVLREQRFMFVLIGVAITTLFFLFLQPELMYAGRYSDSSIDARVLERMSVGGVEAFGDAPYRRRQQAAVVGFGGKIPLGLQRGALRIVVTRGAGFVGSHLVDRLIERGDSVIVVDNFFTGRKENVMHHFGNPRFELIRHDVVEPLLLEVDQIYHLACPASPVHYKFNPIKTIISLS